MCYNLTHHMDNIPFHVCLLYLKGNNRNFKIAWVTSFHFIYIKSEFCNFQF